MIYLFLNIVVILILSFFTHLVDQKVKSNIIGVSSFSVSMLIASCESVVFTLALLLKLANVEALISPLLRIVYSLDGIFLVVLCFGLIENVQTKRTSIQTILKVVLCLFSIYVSFFRFTTVEMTFDNGIIITSNYLFSGVAREFFSWTWVTVFSSLYRYVLPVISYIFLLLIQEDKASQLEKYQDAVIGEAFILMWIVGYIINFIGVAVPAFIMLYMYRYMVMFIVIYMALSKTTVPSGKGLVVSIVKSVIIYIIPAFLIGFICYKFQPTGGNFEKSYIVYICLSSIVIFIVSLWISGFLSSSAKLYTADYEESLEKDLATLDYKNAEMDQVTARMFEIIRRNIEASSMSVYILTGQNELEVAYSSNNMNLKIPLNNPMFDALLNINKSIVCYSQIEKEHDISVVENELREFFKVSKSDALFLLNEGHNIFGVITLGKKVSGDHYKDYDYNVFVKLYSYFFVFGYFMRNISNKDVMSVVNREIRMSSQIITSIQENIDHPKSTKVDIGYLMVPAHNIGGEFIDMIRLTETRHLFVVGDLSGKGIAASMNMVILKSIIRTYLGETHDFKQLVVKLNSFIRDSLRKGTIFAGLFALVDFETDTMYYINCGVPTLMMYTQVYNNVIEIQGSGHILGFVKDISPYISVKTTKLNRGDIIVACTDGVIQSHSLRGEQFGKERLQQAVLDNSTYPAQRMAQFTFDGLRKFMSKEMEDDVSLLVIKYEGLPVENKEEVSEKPVAENVEVPADSPIEAVADEEIVDETPSAENVIEEPVVEESPIEEPVAEEPVMEDSPAFEETPVEETPVEEKTEKFVAPDLQAPEGFDMSELGDLDDLMKEAGL